jgi:amidophosphoribosyltransferase
MPVEQEQPMGSFIPDQTDRPHEKCGVFGIYDPGSDAARLTHLGLLALQHRGQEASGIATSDAERMYLHRDLGLVYAVYNEPIIAGLPGDLGIGHNRYSTSMGSTIEHAQPVARSDRKVAIAHNGNLPSVTALETFLREHGQPVDDSNDTEMMTDAITYLLRKGANLEEAISDTYGLFTGAFSLAILTRDKLAAVRDPAGIRPLSIGSLNGGFVVASETCALDIVNAKFIRDVRPGEMVVFDGQGMHSHQLVEGDQKLDIFEVVYFSRPDSILFGKSVYSMRKNFGIRLAEEYPIKADIIIPILESATPAAIGYSNRSGIPFEMALAKNRYADRTFISPDERLRDKKVEMKLNPIPDQIRGKSVIVIDDSIVRGTTIERIVRMLRGAGAAQVHVLSSSPPVRYPDFYGVDTRDQKKLIAAFHTIEQIRERIGADSLGYLSFEGMMEATGLPAELFSTSCFTGIYPIDIRERSGEIVRFT